MFKYRETKFSLKVGLGQEELHGIRNDLRKIHVSWYKRLKLSQILIQFPGWDSNEMAQTCRVVLIEIKQSPSNFATCVS